MPGINWMDEFVHTMFLSLSSDYIKNVGGSCLQLQSNLWYLGEKKAQAFIEKNPLLELFKICH